MGDQYLEPISTPLLLSLWRARWGKAGVDTLAVPYVRGKLNNWSNHLTHARFWMLPGLPVLVLTGCFLLAALVISLHLSPLGQFGFAVFLLAIALYVKRYTGTFFTLTLGVMAAMVSARYFYWRLSVTLEPQFNAVFLAGFALWAAELFLFVLLGLEFVQHVWPLKWSAQPLPTESHAWPSVDVFVVAGHHNQSADMLQAMTLAAVELSWPKKKMVVHLLDVQLRETLKLWCDSLEVVYSAAEHPAQALSERVNQALASSHGDYVLVLDGQHHPQAKLLKQTMGWLVSHPSLSMVETPDHCFAPGLHGRSQKLFPASPQGPSFSLTRRSMLLAAGGFTAEPVSRHQHTGRKLQAHGFGVVYAGWSSAHPLPDDVTVDAEKSVIFGIAQAFNEITLTVQQKMDDLRRAMQFYYPCMRLVFFVAPAAYLLAGMHLMQSGADLWALYALPHVLLGHIALSRMNAQSRLTVFTQLRETILGWYLTLPTTLSFIRTKVNQLWRLPRKSSPNLRSPAGRIVAIIYGLAGLINLASIVLGSWFWAGSAEIPNDITALYLLWSTYNLMRLFSMLAVTEEARAIEQHQLRCQKLTVMLQLPGKRTLSCQTQNFPAMPLCIQLPLEVTLPVGSVVTMSILHGLQEAPYQAQVVSFQARQLQVRIMDAATTNYRALAAAVFSRSHDWPKWLPGPRADRPWPRWVSQYWTHLISVVTGKATYLQKWIQKWKIK